MPDKDNELMRYAGFLGESRALHRIILLEVQIAMSAVERGDSASLEDALQKIRSTAEEGKSLGQRTN